MPQPAGVEPEKQVVAEMVGGDRVLLGHVSVAMMSYFFAQIWCSMTRGY